MRDIGSAEAIDDFGSESRSIVADRDADILRRPLGGNFDPSMGKIDRVLDRITKPIADRRQIGRCQSTRVESPHRDSKMGILFPLHAFNEVILCNKQLSAYESNQSRRKVANRNINCLVYLLS